MDELMVLEECLDFLKQDNLQNIIIEADFELIINSVKRICYGTELKKVLSHWRLIQVFQRIQFHLLDLRTVSFTHVWRTTNKLADILANKGALCTKSSVKFRWQEMPQGNLRENCLIQADEDRSLYRNRVGHQPHRLGLADMDPI